MKLFKILNNKAKIILSVQAICMLIGASTHIKWILENGVFSKKMNVPFFSTVFWDSLAFLDIIAAILIIIRPRVGVLLTLTIITTDVIHNNLIVLLDHQHINEIGITMWVTKYWMLIGQILFMIFVFATVKNNLAEIKTKETLVK